MSLNGPEGHDGRDARRGRRLPVDLAATLGGRLMRPAHGVDLSLVGCLVRSGAALDAGAGVNLRVDLPDGLSAGDPMGAAVVDTPEGEGLVFSCAACHAGNLLGRPVLGLTNRVARPNAFFHIAKPLVAAVDGFALGGGFELALMADLMVLGPTARVGLPETNLGLIPGAGGGQRLLALAGRARAMRMVLTGEVIDAATAYDWGIATHLTDGPALAFAEPLTARLATRAPLALMAAKAALIAGSEQSLALADERAGFEALLDSADKAEGIRAFHARTKPEFRGK
jgi:hypothetical protein